MRGIRTGYEDGVRRNRRKGLLGDMFDLLLAFVDVIIGAFARLMLLGIILLTSACAGKSGVVAYGPMTARGGYQEDEIEPGVWRVLARSGGEAGPGYSRNMAEYRAAEMLKARGFPWVQILEELPHAVLGEELGGGRRRVISEDMELTVRGAHDPSKPTDCRQTGLLRCWTFTPDMMMKRARKHLRFTTRSAPERG